jgi:NAD(P)-dependent dehydrogenase (short-subunit alcohol dehydrogenase family)
MRAVVTGASGGIGGAVVNRLVSHGWDVIAHDIRPPDTEKANGAHVVGGDLTSPEGLEALRSEMGQDGVDCVVAAHGVEGADAIPMVTPERTRRIVELNFLTVVRLFEAAEAHLLRTEGTFVAIASQAGLLGEANNAAYCASKFAVVGWIRELAREYVPRGVKLHAICPGCVDTPLLEGALVGMARGAGVTLEEMTARRRNSIPVGRFAAPSEIAALIEHVISLRGGGGLITPITGGEVLW